MHWKNGHVKSIIFILACKIMEQMLAKQIDAAAHTTDSLRRAKGMNRNLKCIFSSTNKFTTRKKSFQHEGSHWDAQPLGFGQKIKNSHRFWTIEGSTTDHLLFGNDVT